MGINIEIELEKIKTKHFNNEEDRIKELKCLYEISDNNEGLLFEMGKSFFFLNDFDSAIFYLSKVLQINNNNIYSVDLLNKAYKAQNKIYKSLRILYKYRQFFVDTADEEIISLYINSQRYDLLIKYIYKYMNGEHFLKNKFYNYALSVISEDNFKNDRKKVIKYSKKILQNINKNKDVKFYNSVLNELEIAQRKVILQSYPRRMTVSLISTCNLRCKMCPYDKNKLFVLSKYQVDDIISVLPYVEEIEWNGGEAFLFKYFNELLDAAYKNNVKQYVTSNGLLINDTYAEKIVKYDIDLTLSIDSVDKELYENIRFGAKFDLLLQRIEKINYFAEKFNKKVNLSINSVLSKYNYKYENNFFDIIKFAKKHGFSTVRISIDQYDKDKNLISDILFYFNKYRTDLAKLAQNLNINLQFIMPSVESCLEQQNNISFQSNDFNKNKKNKVETYVLNMVRSFYSDFKNIIFSESGNINFSVKNDNKIKKCEFCDSIKCSLPLKKFILSFKGDFKPECVCPDFISHISKGENIWLVYEKIRYFIYHFLCKMENPILNKLIEKYKNKYDFIPLPVYKNIKECWNGKEIVDMRKKIYMNNLDCLNKCYLSDKIKHNI